MEYERFKQFILERHQLSFVELCLGRAQDIELAYGHSIEELVQNDAIMSKTLIDLEWKIGKRDLDNYQNTLRHYYEMVHGHKFPMRITGNRRLRDD